MHPAETHAAIRELLAAGHNDCEISRRTGVPRSTVRDIRAPRYVPRVRYDRPTCPRCWRPCKPIEFTPGGYAELLGLYLGDGYICRAGRTFRLYCNHLPCLFPQHGPGKKHERPIVLEPWQQAIVDRAPWALLRGLIWSDGCCFVNETGPYAYKAYDFFNLSSDILDLFTQTCDAVGVEYRRYAKRVRINRRNSVDKLLFNVGEKG